MAHQDPAAVKRAVVALLVAIVGFAASASCKIVLAAVNAAVADYGLRFDIPGAPPAPIELPDRRTTVWNDDARLHDYRKVHCEEVDAAVARAAAERKQMARAANKWSTNGKKRCNEQAQHCADVVAAAAACAIQKPRLADCVRKECVRKGRRKYCAFGPRKCKEHKYWHDESCTAANAAKTKAAAAVYRDCVADKAAEAEGCERRERACYESVRARAETARAELAAALASERELAESMRFCK